MLYQIFPQIVYQDNLDISNYVLEGIEFDEGFSSNDCILNLEQFKDIKNQIETHLKKYTHEVLGIDKDIEFYITRSWLYKVDTPKPEANAHHHTNSFFTGVLYLSIEEQKDAISFEKKYNFQYLNYSFEEANIYNQTKVTFFPKKNDLLIFDAALPHAIGAHLSNYLRLSLAFEVFAKGSFGSHNRLEHYNIGKLIL